MTDAKTSSSLPVSPTTYSSSSTLRRTLSVYTPLLFCTVLSQICYYSRDGSAWRTSFFSSESDGAELTDSLKEPNFRNALQYSVIIAIPMVADLILDFALLGHRFQERLHWYSRATVLIALTTPNLLLLTVDFGEMTNQAYVCGYWFFRIATILSALAFTATLAFKNKTVVSSGVLSMLQFGVMGYIVKGISILCRPPLHDSLEKLSQFTRILGLLTLLHCGLQKYINRDSIFLTRMLEPTELTLLTYAVCLAIMHFSFVIASAYTKRYSCDYITTFVYIQMAFVVTITVLQTKINRMEHVRQSKFNEERQAFIRYISHEIRTPLNTVFLGLELLTTELKKLQMSSDDVPVSNLMEIVGDIQSPCQISLAILDDLLTLDKVEGGKMTLDLKHTDCCDFIATVVKPFRLNAKEKSIDLSTNFSLVSEQFILEACMHVDPSKMGQVIRNLISNAIKFTPAQGKVVVTVKHEVTASGRYSIEQAEVSSSRDEFAGGNHWLRIEVADSGAGISAQNQTKLFGQYVQFNANKLQEGKGSGLGLWISKGIAELHGGIIGVYSEGENKGSTFYLDLPVFFHKVGKQSENENEKKTECKHTTTEARSRTSPTSRTSSSRTSSTSRSPVSRGSTDISVVKFAAAPCKVEHASRHTVPGPTPNIPIPIHIPIPMAGFLPAIVPTSSGFLSCMSQMRYSADSKDSSAGFLSSADHFMVTSTPASRSSERVTRSSGIVSLESYEDYFLETSGQGSPVSIREASAFARDASNKLSRRQLGQNTHSAHSSSTFASPAYSDNSSSFSPAGVRRGSEDSSCSKGRYYSFSTLVADRLNSALEAIAALSFQDATTVTLNPLCGPEKLLSSCSSPTARSSIKITAPALRLENGVDVIEEKGSREKSQSNDCAGGSADLSIISSGISSRGKQRSRKRAGSELTHIDLVRPVNEGVSNININPSVSPSTSASARVVRCLVVDDSATSRRMLRRLLTAQNYFVLEATDGKNCIYVWEGECEVGESVDVIFMDSLMPVMTGPEATKILRGKGYTGLIVGLSGLTHVDDIEHFKQSGADVVLTKPLKFAIMDVLVKEYIKTRL